MLLCNTILRSETILSGIVLHDFAQEVDDKMRAFCKHKGCLVLFVDDENEDDDDDDTSMYIFFPTHQDRERDTDCFVNDGCVASSSHNWKDHRRSDSNKTICGKGQPRNYKREKGLQTSPFSALFFPWVHFK